MKETNALFDSILLTLPRQAAAEGKGPNEVIDELCESILSQVAKPFDLEGIAKKFPVLYEESMNTVLGQECVRFNRLVKVVRGTLADIRKAIVGLVVMSTELEEIFNAMLIGKIPAKWMKSSYPSLKSLGGYVKDFVNRLNFLQKWIDEGKPCSFWVSGFFFTQAFLTGVRQNYARQNQIAIDRLVFDFEMTKVEGDNHASITEPPDLGVIVYGFYMEGMRWDRERMLLAESVPKQLFDLLPCLQLIPVVTEEKRDIQCYLAPVYKTSERKGVLATTGHSSNFVMVIELPSDKELLPPNELNKKEMPHWVNRGAALLCGLDD